MLSEDLRSLEGYFKDCLERRQPFTETGLRTFFNGLRQARRDAERMERSATVSQEVTADHLNSGKVTLFPMVARPVPPVPHRPDGGSAA